MSRLYYDKPAAWKWERALPIGNGRLGAMIYGEADFEHLQLNEDSLWYGGFVDRNNHDAAKNLQKVRELILSGKIPEAERLLKYAFSGTPQSMEPYQALGDLYIDFTDRLKDSFNYKSELNLEDAIHIVSSTDKLTGVTFTRETFASAPADCVIMKISADRPGSVSINASLQRSCFYESTCHTDDTLYMSGDTTTGGISFLAGMKVIATGGSTFGMGEHIITEDADSVIVLITAATTFRKSDPKMAVDEILDRVSSISYDDLKKEHVTDYRLLFKRVKLDIPYDKQLDMLSTDARLERISEEVADNGLVSTYFDFGRYLLISCSRKGTLPANLQGIWCRDFNPAWQSKYTININTEMNYWPSGICNLAECEEPLFDLLERMLPNGEKTAKEMYNCRGFVAHHNTNIWGDCAPQDICISSTYWVMGGAWLCTHIWKHYLYCGDKEFLTRMYPVLKSSVLFFVDYLIEVDGEMVTCPSISPENTYIMDDGTRGNVCAGAAMDIEILRDLFEDFLCAADILGEKDKSFINRVNDLYNKLPPIRIGKHGQIMEWNKDYEEADPGHRHISQLYALHPSHQITVDGTPELAKAAKVTLKRRLDAGGGHTGWSRAWIMNMYARLWDGEKVYSNLIALFRKSTLPDLLDNHPPFQIDGNFGATAAIAEMFLQSDSNRCVVLPALPDKINEGRITGLLAEGGAEYDIGWKQGRVVILKIKASRDYSTELIYNGNSQFISMKAGEVLLLEK